MDAALKLGAVSYGYTSFPRQLGGPKHPGIFAYHFFNAAGREVGLWMAALGDPVEGSWQVFETPREWSAENHFRLQGVTPLGVK